MALFNLFKKKSTDSTFPENELEKSLMSASFDASTRDDFYTKLLSSDLFVLTTEQSGLADGTVKLEKDATFQCATFNDGSIPIFTATNRIFDKGIVKNKVPFLSMKGRDLFENTAGAKFILNPYSDYGKEFTPQEIHDLLAGTIFGKGHHEHTIKQSTQVLIGQPSEYPTDLVNALIRHFKQSPHVNKAHLALISEGTDSAPRLLVALEMNGTLSEIAAKAGTIAEMHLKKGEVVDFMHVNNNGGISDYFLNESKPFFTR